MGSASRSCAKNSMTWPAENGSRSDFWNGQAVASSQSIQRFRRSEQALASESSYSGIFIGIPGDLNQAFQSISATFGSWAKLSKKNFLNSYESIDWYLK